MEARIHLPLSYQKFAGRAEAIKVHGSTVGECRREMFQQCLVKCNGQNTRQVLDLTSKSFGYRIFD